MCLNIHSWPPPFSAGAAEQSQAAISNLHALTAVCVCVCVCVCATRMLAETHTHTHTVFPTLILLQQFPAQRGKSLMLINGRNQSMRFLINPWEWCCEGMRVEKSRLRRMQFTSSRPCFPARDPYVANHFADHWQLTATRLIIYSFCHWAEWRGNGD